MPSVQSSCFCFCVHSMCDLACGQDFFVHVRFAICCFDFFVIVCCVTWRTGWWGLLFVVCRCLLCQATQSSFFVLCSSHADLACGPVFVCSGEVFCLLFWFLLLFVVWPGVRAGEIYCMLLFVIICCTKCTVMFFCFCVHSICDLACGPVLVCSCEVCCLLFWFFVVACYCYSLLLLFVVWPGVRASEVKRDLVAFVSVVHRDRTNLVLLRMRMILLIMGMVMTLVMNVLEISTDFGNIIPLVSLLMLILMLCRLAFSRPSRIFFCFFFCSRSPCVRCLRCPHRQRTRREENGSWNRGIWAKVDFFVTNSLTDVDVYFFLVMNTTTRNSYRGSQSLILMTVMFTLVVSFWRPSVATTLISYFQKNL